MTQGFYINNGKWLNCEQIPHVLESSELVYYNDEEMLLWIRAVWSWYHDYNKYGVDLMHTMNEYLAFIGFEICMDESNPQEYLLLRRKA